MSLLWKFHLIFLISLLDVVFGQLDSVFFKYYKNGQLTYTSTGNNEEQLSNTGCNATDKFAFIIHGWQESCNIPWVPLLRQELTTNRGGCIICIDYGMLASEPYPKLLKRFNALEEIMTDKLKYLSFQGMDPNNTYLFGFSFGGQLSVAIGKSYGAGQIKEIDTCDMSGPGFYNTPNSYDHKNAAQNVQCIHTSFDLGTLIYACHQNWRMGFCGLTQPAAITPIITSHLLCPYFYVSAFNNSFQAIDKPSICLSSNPAPSWPEGFQMGYMETRKPMVLGELFALTSFSYPYNVLPENTTIG